MKTTLFAYVIFSLILLAGCSKSIEPVSITINTVSQREGIKTNIAIEKLSETSKIISITITNSGTTTEELKDIQVKFNDIPVFNTETKFLYGSYEMEKPARVFQGIADSSVTETVLMAKMSEANYFKIGALTWNIFVPQISYSQNSGLKIFADGEKRILQPGETIEFEKIVIESGSNWQDMLYAYGEQIAKVQNIKPKNIIQYKGWSTWDYYGGKFTGKDVALNIEYLKPMNTSANLIQLDGGWWNERADYLGSRSDLEGGMKGMAKLIADNGYTPGIHFDGFRASTNSQVYKSHPDWFLKDQNDSIIRNTSAYFDYSNPAACEYIKNIAKTIKEDWGYKYFKIDFVWYGMKYRILRVESRNGVKELKAFNQGMTSLERTRAGLKAMREGIGEAFLLGCSAQFGSTFGIVDGLRTGGDVNPRYDAFVNRCLQNGGNFYLNHTVVQNDADYLVLRSKEDEEAEKAWGKQKFGGDVTLNEAKMWADYVTLFGGIKLSSDNLKILRPERKELVKKAFEINSCTRFIPIDFWDKAKDKNDAFNIMLGTNEQGVFLALFNWNDTELDINLSNFTSENIEAVNAIEQPSFEASNNSFSIKLKPRTSMIFKLNGNADFDKVRKEMTYSFNSSK